MLLISPPIPSICITPAPPVQIEPVPYSPFGYAKPDVDEDDYRANHLSLPPSAESSPWHFSPLRFRSINRTPPKGLSRDQFDSLLKASRDTRAKAGAHKIPDLRKELALKNQSPKQLERRARFLSKVNKSSLATISVPDIDITVESPGPESACFSMSPLKFASEYSAVGSVAEISEDLVAAADPSFDGRLAGKSRTSSRSPPPTTIKSSTFPPSLDEISARLKPERASRRAPLSPLFISLTPSIQSSSSISDQTQTIPVRSLTPNEDMFDAIFSRQDNHSRLSPSRNLTPESGRAVTPRSGGVVADPTVHAARADTARDMIVILKRRNSPPPGSHGHGYTRTSTALRRCSAPAKMQRSGRGGLDHATALPQGGF